MNADGYALLEINLKGQAKCYESRFFDIRLDTADFDTEHITANILWQLPDDLKDVLVMCLFKYRSESSYDYWSGGTEYENHFDLITHHVVQTAYKEFYRFQLTETAKSDGSYGFFEFLPEEEQHFARSIAEWEEFYEEDFKPTEKKTN